MATIKLWYGTYYILLIVCMYPSLVGRHRMYRKRLSFVAPLVARTGVVLLSISIGSLTAYQRILSES